MTSHGQIQDGVDILDGQSALPGSTEVAISLSASVPTAKQDEMTPAAVARYHAALARIDALRNENLGDNFSGANHDQVLYGDGA